MLNKLKTITLCLVFSVAVRDCVLAQNTVCKSDLYRSLNSSLKQGDSIETIIRYLEDRNVKYMMSDQDLRSLAYVSGKPLPERFSVVINNPLPSGALFISRSEIVLLRFVDRRLESLTCELLATGP